MIFIFPSLSNLLRSFAVNVAAFAGHPKASDPTEAAADESPEDEDAAAQEALDEFTVHRWAYRGPYRSMFPPIF